MIPYVTRHLISSTSPGNSTVRQGVGFALGVSFMFLISAFLENISTYLSTVVGAKSRAVLIQAIYAKNLKISAKGRLSFPNGKITNMLSTDCHRIDFALGFFHYTWTFPISIIIAVVLIVVNIGPPGLLGLGVIFLAFLLIIFLGKTLFKARTAISKITDSRITAMREILNSMKIIKYYSWENPSYDKIHNIRKKELHLVTKLLHIRNFLSSTFASVSTIAGLVSFILLSKTGGNLNPATVFSSLSIFNILRMPIMLLPLAFMTSTDAFQAQKRIHALLSAPDMDHYIEKSDSSDPTAIRISNGSFIWETESDKNEKAESDKMEEEDDAASVLTRQLSIVANVTEIPAISEAAEEFKEEEQTNKEATSKANHTKFKGLVDLSFEIQKGEFIVITGSIGSGKSSLLSAIAGTMVKTQGNVALSGSLAYCGVPWVQNASIRDNITFGNPYDEQWYQYVVKVCSLQRDFEILPAGDATEVGERGITLSGGQKARINLARAVYRRCDIILLDDVLSAVDAHVGKSILEDCILGALAGKTRVLATHQISIINSADRVIFLDGTGSIVVDKPDALRFNNSDFDALMKLNDKKDDNVKENTLEIKGTTESNESSNDENDNGKLKSSGALMQDEDKNENGVPAEVYLSFIKYGAGAFKYVFLPVFVILVTLATFSQIFTNTWLSFWTANKFNGRHDNFYIGIFVLLAVMSIILLFSFYTMMTLVTRNTSAILHMKAVHGILHSPMYFFDSSPLGRILNRFAHDTDSFDNEVSDQARFFIAAVANIIGVFILVIIYLPWFALAIVFLMSLFFCASIYYRSSAREIKRLDSTGRSVVISHFSETLSGVSTIVAYGAQKQFLKHNEKAINRMNSAYFLTLVNQHWLAMRLDMIGCAILIFVTILCATRTFHISPSAVGLIISYLLQIVGMMTFLVRELATVENNMNAVERIHHYGMKLDQEAAYNIPETAPPDNWPEHGAIKFKNVTMSYRPSLPPVLKNISLDIKKGEKIGICGRTGAGKSTIMTALYRLVEPSSGSIIIDDIDISTLGLHELRSKLSIIPQDPVLFQGTIRSNLDPFGLCEDRVLWDALRKAWLLDSEELNKVTASNRDEEKPGADGLRFHLDAAVEDDGNNFSLGERQLVALARALVRNSQILILDEATSSVDYHTDNNIQSTITNSFKHCTILCIAHRLSTIINYDRILVLDAGEVAEFDTPKNLFNIPNGAFRSMCINSGITSID
jgi:ABC-type multidrug transport system fused ATPase/permease subunit